MQINKNRILKIINILYIGPLFILIMSCIGSIINWTPTMVAFLSSYSSWSPGETQYVSIIVFGGITLSFLINITMAVSSYYVIKTFQKLFKGFKKWMALYEVYSAISTVLIFVSLLMIAGLPHSILLSALSQDSYIIRTMLMLIVMFFVLLASARVVLYVGKKNEGYESRGFFGVEFSGAVSFVEETLQRNNIPYTKLGAKREYSGVKYNEVFQIKDNLFVAVGSDYNCKKKRNRLFYPNWGMGAGITIWTVTPENRDFVSSLQKELNLLGKEATALGKK